jgi:hypothetical protein
MPRQHGLRLSCDHLTTFPLDYEPLTRAPLPQGLLPITACAILSWSDPHPRASYPGAHGLRFLCVSCNFSLRSVSSTCCCAPTITRSSSLMRLHVLLDYPLMEPAYTRAPLPHPPRALYASAHGIRFHYDQFDCMLLDYPLMEPFDTRAPLPQGPALPPIPTMRLLIVSSASSSCALCWSLLSLRLI